jgi:hypothetical protein
MVEGMKYINLIMVHQCKKHMYYGTNCRYLFPGFYNMAKDRFGDIAILNAKSIQEDNA